MKLAFAGAAGINLHQSDGCTYDSWMLKRVGWSKATGPIYKLSIYPQW